MSDKWYWAKGKQKCGPFSYEQLRQMAGAGVLAPADMVFNDGASQWVPARDVPGLAFAAPDPPMALPAEPAWAHVPAAPAPDPADQRQAAWDRLRQVAFWQRRLILHPLLVFCAVPAFVVASGLLEKWLSLRGPVFTVAAWACFLGLLLLLRLVTGRCTRRLAAALGERPGGGLGSFWALSQEATRRLRAAGLTVGFFGASLPATPPPHFRPSPDTPPPLPRSKRASEAGRAPVVQEARGPVGCVAGWDESAELVPAQRSSPGLANVLLAFAALLSVPFFCLNEFLGKPFLILAGLIWIVFGVRAVVTGSVPSFSGRVHRRPVAYRLGGVVVTLLGLAAAFGGVAGLFLASGQLAAERGARAPAAAAPGAPSDEEAVLARLVMNGLDLVKQEKYDEAERAFNEAQRLAPRRPEPYAGRGAVHLARGDYDKAIADCTEAIRLGQHQALAYSKRGAAHKQKGEYDRAIADCTEAIRLNSEDWTAYLFRAGAYFEKQEDDRAIADYTEVIRLQPKVPQYYVARASVYLVKNDADRAIADLSEAIRLDPQSPQTFRLRARAYQAKGDDAKAGTDLLAAHVLEMEKGQK